jgi:predicted transcriptional regulator
MAKKQVIEISKKQAETLVNATKDALNLSPDSAINISLGKKKRPNMPDFTMIFHGVGMMVVKEITPAALSVFWLFLCKLPYSNHIGINQSTIAEETTLSIASVKRAVKELKEKKLIISYADQQDSRRLVYMINPVVAWRGDNLNRVKKVQEIVKSHPGQLRLFDGKDS